MNLTWIEPKHTGNALYSFAGSAAVTFLLWLFGEPLLIRHFGSGAPWWAYGLLFLRLMGGMAQMLATDTALRQGCYQPEPAANAQPADSTDTAAPLGAEHPSLDAVQPS